MERLHVRISGRVQGVFFRAHTQETAAGLNLTGWVRNTSEGDVEAVAEGPKDQLEAFLNWCRRGPSSAHVSNVDAHWEAATGEFANFSIKYW
jgi:acylphosphatase